MFNSLISQPLSTPLRQMNPVSDQQKTQKAGEMGPTWSNVGLPKPLLPTKRKAAADFSSDSSPRLSPASVLNKKNMQLQTMTNSQGSLGSSNKRMMRNESISSKTISPRVQTPKNKTAGSEVSPKVQSESFEAVRSKMRETLAAALSIGNQNKEEVLNEDKSGSADKYVDLQPETKIQKSDSAGKSDGQKPEYNYVMPDTDGSFGNTFFAEDELLQGNGLSWAWDMEVAELKEVKTDEKRNPVPMNEGNELSPQELAIKIEAELYKLFGGVNKKYKEKGRSLMFNLKDRNNPELREKVLSVKISPERLCLMTPEELASKELSEWRMAKAEELDKMIVLPDSDVDMRRLVKKTHKGEYQVEVEQDDGVSVEVSVGSSSLTHFRPKKKNTDHLEGEKSGSEKMDATDGTEIMQDVIVDEFKDEGFLPPIVSLDEFMESLNSEPPFENLPVDAKETKTLSVNDNSETWETGNEKPSSANPFKVELHTNNRLDVKAKPTEERKALPSFRAETGRSVGESLWEGDLQLTLSSTVSVIGLFRSGEKTSTNEWPGSMEIKGRVRLQAFEKFLQELPMSRSRAVMVVHFVLKDDSSEFHRSSLSEAVDSYVAEERVGFGEPCPGVEVYFCPPHERTIEILSKLLSKDQTDLLKTTDNGLTGVVVWRRPHPSSANSSSHHKHHRKHSSRRLENINSNTNSSKSLHFSHNPPPQPDNDDIPPGFGPGVVARAVDDLPEFTFSGGSDSSGQTLPAQVGTGSGSASGMTRPDPPKPVAQMRRLVYEYGQIGNNTAGSVNANRNGSRGSEIENKRWNQDDDDDMPEWQPQSRNHHRSEVPNHLVDQVLPVIQQPMNIAQNGWVQVQPLPPHGRLPPPNAAIPWQHYGGQWRPDDPSGRGF